MRFLRAMMMTERGWGLALLAIILLVGAACVQWVANAEEREMRRALLEETRIAAEAINMDQLKRLTGSAADINSPDYQWLKEQLASMCSASPRYRFLYIFGRLPNGTVFFFVDSEPASSEDYSPPGEVYAEASNELLRSFGTGVGFVEGPTRDRWGTWVSGLAPLSDHETGRVEAVFGMDVDARTWGTQIAAHCVVPVSITFLLAGLVGAFFMARHRSERIRADEKLKGLELRLKSILNTTGTGLAVIDANLSVRYVDDKRQGVYGSHEGRKCYEYFLGVKGPCPDCRVAEAIATRKPTVSEQYLPQENHYVQITAIPFQEQTGEWLALHITVDISDRKASLVQQERVNQLQRGLLAPGDLTQKLKAITDDVVGIFSADFCRIWVCGNGDLCEQGCMHAEATEGPHVCSQRDKCLRLIASSGRYTHTDGRVHRRVPFGCYKIGMVASGKEHKFLTNDAAHDPRVHNHEWVNELGLVSFAGYQLRPAGGETLGVIALFSKQPISPEEDAHLDALSNAAARVIATAQAEETLRDSEETYRSLFESSRDAMMTIMAPSWRFTACNPACVGVFGLRSVDDLLSRGPWDVSPERQPNGVPSGQMALEHIETAMREGSNFFEWTHKRLDGGEFPSTVLLTRCEVKGQEFLQATVRDITRQKRAERELQKAHDETKGLLESLSSILIGVDTTGLVTAWNRVAARFFGIESSNAVGRALEELDVSWDREPIRRGMAQCRSTGRPARVDDVRYTRLDGTDGLLGITVNPIVAGDAPGGALLFVAQDITERKILEGQLSQAQRLESVGRLAAGIAHEINTPTQFIGDNIRFLATSFPALKGVLTQYGRLMEAARTGSVTPEEVKEAEAVSKAAKLDYLLEQIPEAISDSLEGLDRVAKIVRAMKDFSHPGEQEMSSADINRAIESTVTVAKNEWKYVADMVLNLDPSLPSVPCFAADFNQVILNIIVNASHAIADALKATKQAKGTITVTTSTRDGCVEVRIADTGTGIPEQHRNKLFDPFFTTKPVGKGTGQGLAIARSVIVDKHHGALTFETEMGKGTTFIIRLPLNIEPEAREAGAE